MGTLTLSYRITVAISGACACLQAASPAAARGGPYLFSISVLSAVASLPHHASALSLDYAKAVEKEKSQNRRAAASPSTPELQPVTGPSTGHGERKAPATVPAPDSLTEFKERKAKRERDSAEANEPKSKNAVRHNGTAEGDEHGLPGIAGAPPPQSGIAKLLPGEAPLRRRGLPGWCRHGEVVEPRTASMRARGFARLARRTFYEEEVVAQPADPLEWACYHPWSAWFLYAILIWVVGTMVAFIMASFCYRSREPKYDEQSHANPEDTFVSGHFGCLSDRQTCLMAFLCPVIRWADTVQMAGVLSFWVAFWILSTCYLPSLAFFVIWGLFPLVPLVMARQNLRGKLGLPAGNETWVSDCCFALFCSCCLVAQEARVVNEAYAIGHTSMPMSGGRVN